MKLAQTLLLLTAAACAAPDTVSRFVPGGPAPCQSDGPVPMKTIDYRGGVVSFEVPAHWVERHFEEGGAEFWEEGHSWTLRLETLTVRPGEEHWEDPQSVLESSARVDGPVRALSSEYALGEQRSEATERGTDLVFDQWLLCREVEDELYRLAIFTLCSKASESESPRVERERVRIRGAVERAVLPSMDEGPRGG